MQHDWWGPSCLLPWVPDSEPWSLNLSCTAPTASCYLLSSSTAFCRASTYSISIGRTLRAEIPPSWQFSTHPRPPTHKDSCLKQETEAGNSGSSNLRELFRVIMSFTWDFTNAGLGKGWCWLLRMPWVQWGEGLTWLAPLVPLLFSSSNRPYRHRGLGYRISGLWSRNLSRG